MTTVWPYRHTKTKKQVHNEVAKLAAGFHCNPLYCKCYGEEKVNITDRKTTWLKNIMYISIYMYICIMYVLLNAYRTTVALLEWSSSLTKQKPPHSEQPWLMLCQTCMFVCMWVTEDRCKPLVYVVWCAALSLQLLQDSLDSLGKN